MDPFAAEGGNKVRSAEVNSDGVGLASRLPIRFRSFSSSFSIWCQSLWGKLGWDPKLCETRKITLDGKLFEVVTPKEYRIRRMGLNCAAKSFYLKELIYLGHSGIGKIDLILCPCVTNTMSPPSNYRVSFSLRFITRCQ